MADVYKYVGERYVPVFYTNPNDGSAAWLQTDTYEPLTIVTYNGLAYTSRRHVPAGINITNTDYWVITGNYNEQMDVLLQRVEQLAEDITENSFGPDTKFYSLGWVEPDIDAYNKTGGNSLNVIKSENKVGLYDLGYEYGNNNWQPFFVEHGINQIDYVVISHYHNDHVLGLRDLQRFLTFNSDTVWYLPEKLTAVDATDFEAVYSFETEVLNFIAATGGTIIRPTEGYTVNIDGDLNISFYNTQTDRYRDAGGHVLDLIYNNLSMCALFKQGSVSVLMTGDCQYKAEAYLYTVPALHNIDIVKYSHHGRNEEFYVNLFFHLAPKAGFIDNCKDELYPATRPHHCANISEELLVFKENYTPTYATSEATDYICRFTINNKVFYFESPRYNDMSVPMQFLTSMYDTFAVTESGEDFIGADPANITMDDFLNALPNNAYFCSMIPAQYVKMLPDGWGSCFCLIIKTTSAGFRNSLEGNTSRDAYATIIFFRGLTAEPNFVIGKFAPPQQMECIKAVHLADPQYNGAWAYTSAMMDGGQNFIRFRKTLPAAADYTDVNITWADVTDGYIRDWTNVGGTLSDSSLIKAARGGVMMDCKLGIATSGAHDVRAKAGNKELVRCREDGTGQHVYSGEGITTPGSNADTATLSFNYKAENSVEVTLTLVTLNYTYNKNANMFGS